MESVFRSCRDHDWFLSAVHGGVGGDEDWPLTLVFNGPPRTRIEVIFEELANVPHVAIVGEQAASVATILRDATPMEQLDELVSAHDLSQGPAERAATLLRLAVAAPISPESRVLTRVCSALVDEDPRIRSAALLAVRFRAWQAYLPIVQEIAANDPERVLREDAETMVFCWADWAVEPEAS